MSPGLVYEGVCHRTLVLANAAQRPPGTGREGTEMLGPIVSPSATGPGVTHTSIRSPCYTERGSLSPRPLLLQLWISANRTTGGVQRSPSAPRRTRRSPAAVRRATRGMVKAARRSTPVRTASMAGVMSMPPAR